ncbi:MAG: hypothetical protein KBG47_08380 [Bacteroidia bacterium]|jgi:ion channel-forming bestrophin family protein|nr:hypothetical protein [Sphingobacteriaceae bacterium]MBP9069510.1 hypothetical protein [Bacteroidia bacterium]
MITYNPKDWFTLIIQFHKSDTFRKLIPSMLALGVFSGLVVTADIYLYDWSFKNSSIVHSILGFALSMLLVFRTNTAYERWWEGRKAWGDAVNNSRNFILKINAFVKNATSKKELASLIINYNYILKNHLRAKEATYVAPHLPKELLDELSTASHKPNVVAKHLYAKINSLFLNKEIGDTQLLLLNDEARSFTNICGICERIKNTPIPYSYNLFLKKIIFLYVFTIPFMFGPDFRYATIAVSMAILYVFASIELIAEEIEDPFGEDDNDLPLDDICDRIETNLNEIIK